MSVRELWRRGQRGWPASFPLVQVPNAPLALALVGAAVAEGSDGSLRGYARAASRVGLAVWAWAELTDGDNPVRRAMGAGGLLYLLAAQAH